MIGGVGRGVLLLVLACATAFNLALAIAIVFRPDELRYGEALLYDHAARLLRGETLYQSLAGPPYTIANYTPWFYVVGAVLRLVFGDGFAPGRLVSFMAALGVAAMVGWLVWRRTRSVWATSIGAAMFLGLGVGGNLPWSAAYKADLLGVAFGMASIVALDVSQSRRGVALAAVLASLAVLTKQSLVGPAIAGAAWLLFCRPRALPLFVGVVGALVLGTGIVAQAATGAFAENVVGSNVQPPFRPLLFQRNLRELATFQAVPAALAVVALARVKLHHDLLAMNWIGALIPMLPLGLYGADANYWLHLAAASAALASVTLWRHRARWIGMVGAAALGLQAVLATGSVAAWHLARPDFLVRPSTAQAQVGPLVERVKGTSGVVLAEPLDVLVLANRPIFFEPTDFGIRERDGSWDPAPVVHLVCRKEVPLVILGYALEDVGERWPAAITAAMQRTMVLEDAVPLAHWARYVYVPNPDPAATC